MMTVRTDKRAAYLALCAALLPALASAQGFSEDWTPTTREVVLNTDFTSLRTNSGRTFPVSGGVFVLRNLTIPAGVKVRAVGSRPLIFICAGKIDIQGELSSNGADGMRVNTLRSANFPAIGGDGGAGGGKGGDGSPGTTARSPTGAQGLDFARRLLGGLGGTGSPSATCGRGSAGGGGSFATAGDPWFKVAPGTGTAYPQPTGRGGYGCLGTSGSANRTLAGGLPGPLVFQDARADNDFFGIGVDLNRRIVIRGELSFLRGGNGGGGGGDRFYSGTWVSDEKGGGGGGGGGAIGLMAAGTVTVGPSGRVSADGGYGGGGEQAGGNNRGACGGAGSGGMVLIYTQRKLILHAHGETYANNDYSFSISADGATGTQGRFGGPEIVGKYPPVLGGTYDRNPLGGFGGMGVVQLMVPPGFNQDGTNTVLDDGIDIIKGTQRLAGAQKQRYLAWRGYPNAQGVRVDDRGQPTAIGKNEGDIRPSPILLPVF